MRAATRGAYGEERYEVREFQERTRAAFMDLIGHVGGTAVIDAARPVNEVAQSVAVSPPRELISKTFVWTTRTCAQPDLTIYWQHTA
jgi:thymidylate kinase